MPSWTEKVSREEANVIGDSLNGPIVWAGFNETRNVIRLHKRGLGTWEMREVSSEEAAALHGQWGTQGFVEAAKRLMRNSFDAHIPQLECIGHCASEGFGHLDQIMQQKRHLAPCCTDPMVLLDHLPGYFVLPEKLKASIIRGWKEYRGTLLEPVLAELETQMSAQGLGPMPPHKILADRAATVGMMFERSKTPEEFFSRLALHVKIVK